MPEIHPLAIVEDGAELADDVRVGPFSYIEATAKLGPGCIIDSHATIKRNTTMGAGNYVGQGSVIGGDPQDRKFKGEPTFLTVGDRNVFREFVTVHRATGEGNSTVVGNDCYLMAKVHLGHNVTLHNNVTIANSVEIAGHCTIEDLVTIGGMVGVHQFVRIGKVAMVGACGYFNRDVPPFMLSDEEEVHDINAVGLRRMGVTSESRLALHKACKIFFKSKLSMSTALETVRREVPSTPEIEYLIDFEERRRQGRNGRGDQR